MKLFGTKISGFTIMLFFWALIVGFTIHMDKSILDIQRNTCREILEEDYGFQDYTDWCIGAQITSEGYGLKLLVLTLFIFLTGLSWRIDNLRK